MTDLVLCSCREIRSQTWQEPAEWEQDPDCPIHPAPRTSIDPFRRLDPAVRRFVLRIIRALTPLHDHTVGPDYCPACAAVDRLFVFTHNIRTEGTPA